LSRGGRQPIELDGSFDADYSVEMLVDTPHVVDHDFHSLGEVPRPDLLLEVTRADGSSWTVGVRAGGPSVDSVHTGIYATPAADALLVVARGDAYLIDTTNPANYESVSTGGPLVAVKPVPKENILLLATPWTVTGIGHDGVLWTTRRLAIDGLRLDESGLRDQSPDRQPRGWSDVSQSADPAGTTHSAGWPVTEAMRSKSWS
jgi:hypothetical protein